NLVGIKRRNWPREAVRELKEAFRTVYFQPGNIRTVAAAARASGSFPSPQAQAFLEFFSGGKRGFARPRREVVVSVTADGGESV
ncbi:MAG: hypothetical protein RIQ79_491, partial [Verrucomicrobiota bacterium]